jgi:hypothetical protein
LLYSLHQMGAAILATPEIELDKDESRKLAEAIKDVAGYYALAFDPKKVAIANLLSVAGFVYGPRIIAWRARRKASEGLEKPAKAPSEPPTQSAVPPSPPPASNGAVKTPTIRPPAKQMAPSQLWPEPAEEFPGLG